MVVNLLVVADPRGINNLVVVNWEDWELSEHDYVLSLRDKFYRKVAFLMYTVNFRPQSLKAASKLKQTPRTGN